MTIEFWCILFAFFVACARCAVMTSQINKLREVAHHLEMHIANLEAAVKRRKVYQSAARRKGRG